MRRECLVRSTTARGSGRGCSGLQDVVGPAVARVCSCETETSPGGGAPGLATLMLAATTSAAKRKAGIGPFGTTAGAAACLGPWRDQSRISLENAVREGCVDDGTERHRVQGF